MVLLIHLNGTDGTDRQSESPLSQLAKAGPPNEICLPIVCSVFHHLYRIVILLLQILFFLCVCVSWTNLNLNEIFGPAFGIRVLLTSTYSLVISFGSGAVSRKSR